MQLHRYIDPIELIQQAWATKREKNPALSLRAFARFLKIPPGRLSEILSRKRRMSPAIADRVAERLGLDPEMRARFISSTLSHPRKTRAGAAASTRKMEESDPWYQQLSIDAFHVISDWYHFAILNLRDCDDFRADESWIAKRLNLGMNEVRLALTRLERLGLIQRDQTGWNRTQAHLTTTHDVRSAGLRKGHRGILERAIESLEAVDVESRDITNITMAIDPDRLPEAKAMLMSFRRKFAKQMEKGNGRTEVYTLAMQFFPLTTLQAKRKI